MDPQLPDPLDARLNAWFDGELPPGERAEVEATLAGRADLAERMRAWEADRAALRAQFAAVLDEPVPARLARVVAVAENGAGGADAQTHGSAPNALGRPSAESRRGVLSAVHGPAAWRPGGLYGPESDG